MQGERTLHAEPRLHHPSAAHGRHPAGAHHHPRRPLLRREAHLRRREPPNPEVLRRRRQPPRPAEAPRLRHAPEPAEAPRPRRGPHPHRPRRPHAALPGPLPGRPEHPQYNLHLEERPRKLRVLEQELPGALRVRLDEHPDLRHQVVHLRRRELGEALGDGVGGGAVGAAAGAREDRRHLGGGHGGHLPGGLRRDGRQRERGCDAASAAQEGRALEDASAAVLVTRFLRESCMPAGVQSRRQERFRVGAGGERLRPARTGSAFGPGGPAMGANPWCQGERRAESSQTLWAELQLAQSA